MFSQGFSPAWCLASPARSGLQGDGGCHGKDQVSEPQRQQGRDPQHSGWDGGAVLAAFPQPCLLMTWIYSTSVTESYSHPCDTQHVLLLAAAGWIQPQGHSSSRAGSCWLPRGIFGNKSCIPIYFPAASREEGILRLSKLVQRTHRTAKEKKPGTRKPSKGPQSAR